MPHTIIESILTTAQAARDAGQTIRIERTLPAVEINRGEDVEDVLLS